MSEPKRAMSDNAYWVWFYFFVLVAICVITVSIYKYNTGDDERRIAAIQTMVNKGIDPIKARCASADLSSASVQLQAMCAIAASK